MRYSTCTLAVALAICLAGCSHEPIANDCLFPPCDCDCPDGAHCYGGVCLTEPPGSCADPANPQYAGWPNDSDLEPNDDPDQAIVLPCGDDAVFTDPVEYDTRCPSRDNYTNGFMNLVLCPEGERDFYAIYLLADETLHFDVLYMFGWTPPRDINARVWTWDQAVGDWREDVAVGLSTNDNEELEVSTAFGTGNPQGWYYLEVFGRTFADVNFYTVSFTLNERYY